MDFAVDGQPGTQLLSRRAMLTALFGSDESGSETASDDDLTEGAGLVHAGPEPQGEPARASETETLPAATKHCGSTFAKEADSLWTTPLRATAWARVASVPGLFHAQKVLSPPQQQQLWATAVAEGWIAPGRPINVPLEHVTEPATTKRARWDVSDSSKQAVPLGSGRPGDFNQGMYFGTLPQYLEQLADFVTPSIRAVWSSSSSLSEAGPTCNPRSVMATLARPSDHDRSGWDRYPFFDQAIVNVYGLGGFIKPHVDLLQFEDGILVVSLGASAVMTYACVHPTDSPLHRETAKEVDVVLRSGDLLLLTGEARYNWTHRIDPAPPPPAQLGALTAASVRVSLTLRRLTASATTVPDTDAHRPEEANRMRGMD